MAKDLFDDYFNTMMEYIIQSLENKKTEDLIGLQCLDSATEYTGYQGMQSFINALFVKTLDAPERAKKMKEELKKDTRLNSISLYDRKRELADRLEKGYIPVIEVKNALNGLRHYFEDIRILVDNEIIEVFADENEKPKYFRLSPNLWDGILQKIKRNSGKETEIYGQAIGKVIAMASKKRGFTSLIPLINCFSNVDSNGMITKEYFLTRCCSRVSRPQRFFYNMLERDKAKSKNIRAITDYEDGKLIMNENGIRAIKNWRKLANSRAIERHRT